MKEDVSRILRMVEEGKIDTAKAGELMEALNKADNQLAVRTGTGKMATSNSDKMLIIRVNTQKGDNVNVNLPIRVIKNLSAALKGVVKHLPGVPGAEELDIQAIVEAVDSGLQGKIVDIKSANGDIVEVSVE